MWVTMDIGYGYMSQNRVSMHPRLGAHYKKVFALSSLLHFPTKFPASHFWFLSLKSLGPFAHRWIDLHWTP